MPPLPDVTTSIQDHGLGLLPPSAANSGAFIGSASAGTNNTVYAFNDIATLSSTLVNGPVVQAAALALAQPNHGTVYVVPCNCSTAGAAGSTSYTRAPGTPSIGTIVASGTPNDAYQFVITITLGESTVSGGGGTFTYSQDNGNTTSAQIAIPTSGTYVVPGTGVTLTFAGTATAFNTGDVATITCTAPYFSGSDFTSAFNALVANPNLWRAVIAVGAASSATNAATFATTLQSLMATQESANRYAEAFMQSNDTDANNISAFANFVGNRVITVAGQELVTSPLDGHVYTRDQAWMTVARILTRPVSEDPGRVATGPLLGVSKLLRDENATPGLDAQRFTTHRTITNLQGFYITDGNTMATTGSDYSLVQNRQVMDVACTLARTALLTFLNDSVRVNPSTAQVNPGGIYELDARRIETYVASAIRAGLQATGDISAVTVTVNRATNVLSTKTIPVTIRIVPLGYGKFITNNIGFSNPALALPI